MMIADPVEKVRTYRCGYVALNVSDIRQAGNFFSEHLGLSTVGDETSGILYCRGGTDHHWIRLHQDPAVTGSLRSLGFELSSETDLEVLARRLDGAGVEARRGVAWDEGIGSYVEFDDPDGNRIVAYSPMVSMPVPVSSSTVHALSVLHAGLFVSDIRGSCEFYTDLLGLRVSDWVEDKALFLRADNGYHHSLALVQSTAKRGLDHVCFLMSTLDDVMRVRARTRAAHIPTRDDVKRHAPSGSVSYYMNETTMGDVAIEVCWDHLTITDEESYRFRVLPLSPQTSDIWLRGDEGAGALGSGLRTS
jgi:catechol 2,3-dioxygenase-like lactoylglutathione lyase family enzyme